MKIINAEYRIAKPDLDDPDVYWDMLKRIEKVGRTCYKSENKITDESAEKFVRNLIKNGHEAMLEHEIVTIVFTVDRGVSHELVRHRLASFAQESTRYCNYSQDKFGNEISNIMPCFFKGEEAAAKFDIWFDTMLYCEQAYFKLLDLGCTPQEARCVLNNSLKTEIVMTMNLRELRHFLKLRAAGVTGKPHPQMLEVAVPLLNELKLKLPVLFEDIDPMEVK